MNKAYYGGQRKRACNYAKDTPGLLFASPKTGSGHNVVGSGQFFRDQAERRSTGQGRRLYADAYR